MMESQLGNFISLSSGKGLLADKRSPIKLSIWMMWITISKCTSKLIHKVEDQGLTSSTNEILSMEVVLMSSRCNMQQWEPKDPLLDIKNRLKIWGWIFLQMILLLMLTMILTVPLGLKMDLMGLSRERKILITPSTGRVLWREKEMVLKS